MRLLNQFFIMHSDLETLFSRGVELLSGEPSDTAALHRVMKQLAMTPGVTKAVELVHDEANSPGTISSLYNGFRSLLIHEQNGWSLAVARLNDESEKISLPTAKSAAFCIRSAEHVVFERFKDNALWNEVDVRPGLPIARAGSVTISHGDMLTVDDLSEFSVPKAPLDVVFLKLEGPTINPVSTTFDRVTLEPVSMGFADHEQTSGDFLATLLAHLCADAASKAPLGASREQRDMITAWVSRLANDPDYHLTVRWKYIQVLGVLSRELAIDALKNIAATSNSTIGDQARATLKNVVRPEGAF